MILKRVLSTERDLSSETNYENGTIRTKYMCGHIGKKITSDLKNHQRQANRQTEIKRKQTDRNNILRSQ